MPGLPSGHTDRKPPIDHDSDGMVHEGTPKAHPVASPLAQPAAAQSVRYRAFTDAAATRQAIFDRVHQAAVAFKPITSPTHTLSLHDVAYEGPETFSRAAEKRAILDGGTLARRLRGTWKLTENTTGNVLDQKRATVANVPYLSERGSFVLNGADVTLASQSRLLPGVFSRRKENGELEAHVNIPKGGVSHRLYLEPETGRFRIMVGQARMPLLPLLRAMGVPEPRIREAWGDALAAENMKHEDASVVDKLLKKVTRDAPTDPVGRLEALRKTFEAMPLDPGVMQHTLGKPYTHVSADSILDTTKKMLAINRGEAETDDRDDLAHMTFLGPEDLLAERVGRDRMSLGRMLWKASKTGSLHHVPVGVFDRGLRSTITSSGLGQNPEEVNPLQVLEQQNRISRMGEGAIGSIDAVPDEARAVHPSQFGFIDALVTPESMKVGVDSRFATHTVKGSDGKIYSSAFRDVKTGKPLFLTPAQAAQRTIAFAGELGNGWQHEGLPAPPLYVTVIRNGKTLSVPRHEVDAEMVHAQHAYSPVVNLVPGFSGVKPQRAVMAARMLTQALPLADAESPHVQSAMPEAPGTSYEEQYGGHLGALKSQHAGIVSGVTPDAITLRTADGQTVTHELYNNFPLNRKTFAHQTPTVRIGQPVKPGELLARSNYTDATGTTALGKNFRVAYVPLRGHNFEDAYAISESAAKKFTSEHMYQHYLEHDDKLHVGKHAHTAVFPGVYAKNITDNFDDNGVIKPGTKVEYGQPLILAARQREQTHASLHKGRKAAFTDASETWEHHSPGVVTDVSQTPKGTLVAVKTYMPAQVGDKIAGRHGNKGVISALIPDHEMPHDSEGRPYEVASNPLGTISRTNPSQHVEAALGKIAAKFGKKYKLLDFNKEQLPDLRQYAEDELRKHGLNSDSTETVFDPVKQRTIKDPFTGSDPQTGNVFFMKLHHTSESKIGGRGLGSYTSEGMPARGGQEGAKSKRVSMMDVNALLSHGATSNLRDIANRGQSHADFWAQFMAGHNPPAPESSFVHDKFYQQLRAAGINAVKTGPRIQVMALDNPTVDALAEQRELSNAETVDWKAGLKPIPGGLFDPSHTGGHGGVRWSAIKLHEPTVNPVMEEPSRRLLGLTEHGFRDVLAGRKELHDETGPHAIAKALDRIDLDKEIDFARREFKGSRKTRRDLAARRLQYLMGAKAQNVHPREWVLHRVPVIPPKFRPVSVMQGSKLPLVADANSLYRDLFEANENLKGLHGQVADVGDERLAVYDAFKAVTGLGAPITPKNQERDVKGFLKNIFGSAPKFSTVQRKLLGSSMDLVGRGVITPDPDLDIDHAGIPEAMAWDTYRPFIVRRLVRSGVPALRAAQAVKNQEAMARQALVDEMGDRPVILTRAPVLHKYGVMGFRPTLVTGNTIKLPPLITKGYGADFDGNCCVYSTKISLQLSPSVLYIDDPVAFRDWGELLMRLTGKELVSISDGVETFTCEIGEFPRRGKSIKDKNGAAVYRVPAGISVQSYDHAAGKSGYYPVTHLTVEAAHACVTVTTARGREVEVSDNESLCVFDDSNGGLKKIKPTDALDKLSPVIVAEEPPGDEFNRDLGWWYGALVSDGWLTDRSVGYAKSEDVKRTEFVRIATEQLSPDFNLYEYRGTAGDDKYADSVKVHLNGVGLRHCVLDCYAEDGPSGRSALRKIIPPRILNCGSRDCLLGLLSGLLDGDGTVAYNRHRSKKLFVCAYSTSSLALAVCVRRLCRRLGIRTGLTTSPANKTRNEAYIVNLSIIDLHSIAVELTSVGEHEQALIAEFVAESPPSKDDLDIVPVTAALSVELSKAATPKNLTLYTAARKAIKYGYLGRSTALRLFDLLPHDFEHEHLAGFTAVIFNRAVHWDRIRTVTPSGTHPVFDLAVPTTKVFAIDNGLVIFDTMSVHVPFSDDAVQESYNKLLPSKNLLSIGSFRAHQLPSQEFGLGLYVASTAKHTGKAPKTFASTRDAVAAYHRGELSVDAPVNILDETR